MMRRPHALALSSAATLLALALGGCSTDQTSSSAPADNLPRRAVSGTVTLDGQPLATGQVSFTPAGGGTGVATSGVIKDGSFSIPKEQGPVPGKYRVSISSRPPVTVAANEEPSLHTAEQVEKVPDRYNTKSTLEAEVKDSDNAPLKFDLTK